MLPTEARPRRSRAAERLRGTVGLFLATTLVLGTAGAVHGWSTLGQIDTVDLGDVLDQFDGAGMGPTSVENYLVVGSDSRAGDLPDGPVKPGEEGLVAGRRSDTIMVVRFDPSTNSAALLSIPRDLYLPIAGTGRKDRVNSAYSRSEQTLVKTVQESLGIPVHHYVEVDFLGFKRLVDAVGGVAVWFDAPTRDKNTGLRVAAPGCVVLDGTRALQYTRARHFEQKVDGAWRQDPTADLGRISRQQDFVRRALGKAIVRASSDPVAAAELIQAAVHDLRLDDDLDIWGLGNRLRTLGSGGLVAYTVPGTPKMLGNKAVLLLDKRAAKPVLDYFAGRSQAVTASTVASASGQAAVATVAPPVPTRAPAGTVPDASRSCR